MKPTPVINFIAWVYLLLGMENFFWAAFRYFHEGVNGLWLRVMLNSILGIAFFGYALWLSNQKMPRPEDKDNCSRTPAILAWGLFLLCFILQYYRFVIWAKGHALHYGMDYDPNIGLTIGAMHDTVIAFLAAFLLSQLYDCLPGPLKMIPRLIPDETVAFSREFIGVIVGIILLLIIAGFCLSRDTGEIGDSYSHGNTNVIKKMQINLNPEDTDDTFKSANPQ